MEYQEKQEYRCAICCKNTIVRIFTVETLDEAFVPDISTCDFNDYKDFKIEGGKIFEGLSFREYRRGKENKAPFGGICNSCLAKENGQFLANFIPRHR